MFRFLGELARGLGQLAFPKSCWMCGLATPDEPASFCRGCRQALTDDPLPSCPRCGGTVGPHVPLAGGCVLCQGESYHFDGVVRLGVYQGMLRDAILRMKRDEDLGEAVAALWAECLQPQLRDLGPTVVVPVPLHWTRYWWRGFNPSDTLARAVAERLGAPCHARLLRRARRTLPQTAQTAAQRRDNVRGAFVLNRPTPLPGKTLLLVDDVLTTGATASEAARPLRALQPRQIVACVVAKSRVAL